MKNSDSDGETKRKRAVFNEEDTCLLTRCCQEHESVLNLNITTGGKKTAKLKAKVKVRSCCNQVMKVFRSFRYGKKF